MFHPEFFPTPAAVIEKMLEPYFEQRERPFPHQVLNLSGRTIFDPGAGSGALLEFVEKRLNKNYYDRGQAKLYCCEVDPDLKATLQGKNYRLVGEDFLTYEGDTIFDLILMNPPFSCADKHILKAWQVVGAGGDVVALCNAETLRNPYTKTRQQLARVIEQYGQSEELGQVFLQAERPTDVEVSLIRLKKPQQDSPFSFQWESKGREKHAELGEHLYKDQVATRDVIGNMMVQFDQLKEQFVALLRAVDGINFYGKGLVNSEYRSAWEVAQEVVSRRTGRGDYASCYNTFTEAMRQEIWGAILDKLHIKKYLTQKVQENFTAFARAQGYMEVTHESVWSLMSMVMANTGTIMKEAVTDVFDEFTAYYEENRVYQEGWKTNSRWKVNRKIILPYWVNLCKYMESFSVSRHGQLSDVDKVMCYLTATDYDKCYTIAQALETRFRSLGRIGKGSFYNECQSEFFNIRFFKKGTLHLEFRDPRLHQEFNLAACAGKQWLPEPEMKAYQERKRSPFAPEPQPEAAPVAEVAPVATVRRLAGPGTQLSLLDLAA